jgi:hypothetical protein
MLLLDARALCFADPFGLALLGSTCHMLWQRDQAVRVSGLCRFSEQLFAAHGCVPVGWNWSIALRQGACVEIAAMLSWK